MNWINTNLSAGIFHPNETGPPNSQQNPQKWLFSVGNHYFLVVPHFLCFWTSLGVWSGRWKSLKSCGTLFNSSLTWPLNRSDCVLNKLAKGWWGFECWWIFPGGFFPPNDKGSYRYSTFCLFCKKTISIQTKSVLATLVKIVAGMISTKVFSWNHEAARNVGTVSGNYCNLPETNSKKPLKIDGFFRWHLLLGWPILGGHVSFRECN